MEEQVNIPAPPYFCPQVRFYVAREHFGYMLGPFRFVVDGSQVKPQGGADSCKVGA